MAQGHHFLTIPDQQGLFTAIKSGRAGESRDDSPVEDEDEEETEEDVHLLPRCSPIPRKRGPSIADETAEYLRIRLALPQRSVSFADASGGELVDVREFAAFDSGDEEDNANWEEEEEKCRRAYLQPVYRVWPEFQAREGSDLTLAVRTNKVEVEKVTAVQDEPLSFDALICVLNVSYHKCVYVRSTMDGWITHSDCVAEYVPGSHEGDSDKFSARLSFAEPYLFNGARIDFVVRYETSDGEFWANNAGRNYSVNLVMSYEKDTGPDNKVDDREIKGILKPSRFRAEDDFDFDADTDNGDEDYAPREAVAEVPSPMCPLVTEPDIDIEIPEVLISPSKSREDLTISECLLLGDHTQDEHPLQDLPENPQQTDVLTETQDTELLIPTESLTVSIHKYPTSNSDRDFVHSVKSNKPFCLNRDNLQSDTAVQAPFDLDITLPAMFPSMQDMGKDDSEEFKDHKEKDEIQSGERRVAQIQHLTSDTMEVDNIESSLQELQESTPQCCLNEFITASANKSEEDFTHSTGHNILFKQVQSKLASGHLNPFKESHETLLENPEILMIKHECMVRGETSGNEQAGLVVKDVSGVIASCMLQSFKPTGVGQTSEDSVIQNVPIPARTPDSEVTEYQQQGHGPKQVLVNVDTRFGSESVALKQESPVLTCLTSATVASERLTTTVQAVAHGDEDGDGEPFMTPKEHLSNEKFELYYVDPASFQKQKEFKSQPSLPSKSLEDSNTDVILGKTLIPSFTFLSATVCLIVGFHEPSIFLIMTLFLVSLCF